MFASHILLQHGGEGDGQIMAQESASALRGLLEPRSEVRALVVFQDIAAGTSAVDIVWESYESAQGFFAERSLIDALADATGILIERPDYSEYEFDPTNSFSR